MLTSWRAGDRDAGGELISRHFRPLYRFFASKVAAPDQAEDLAQRTFAAAVEGLLRFEGRSSVRTWLFAIARNMLRQWVHERSRIQGKRIQTDRSSAADLGVSPSAALALRGQQRTLAVALQRIPLESQVLLELFYWESLTARELAEVFDCPEGTARSRLRSARLELRGVLDELARTGVGAATGLAGLETWAEQLRNAWDE